MAPNKLLRITLVLTVRNLTSCETIWMMVAKSCNKSLLVMFLDLKSNSMWDSSRLPNVRILKSLLNHGAYILRKYYSLKKSGQLIHLISRFGSCSRDQAHNPNSQFRFLFSLPLFGLIRWKYWSFFNLVSNWNLSIVFYQVKEMKKKKNFRII